MPWWIGDGLAQIGTDSTGLTTADGWAMNWRPGYEDWHLCVDGLDWHWIGISVEDWHLICECFLGWLGLDLHGGVEVVLRRDTSVGPLQYSSSLLMYGLVTGLGTDWSDLCQCAPMGCQSVTIQFLWLALIDVWRGHLVIGIWSVWHEIGGLAMDWHISPGLVLDWQMGQCLPLYWRIGQILSLDRWIRQKLTLDWPKGWGLTDW